ncbi:MAG TPA: ABC transporter ATP-binding protein [Ktedonobacterales bacterium]|jgi:ABC-type multidrug transport system fused ATPase/permease subunit|nr:ABC transporter ATP-binding protein [Ktedonobacterales bacterium]
MGFIMDGLEQETYDRAYSDRDLLRRVLGYFRPKLRLMTFVAVMVVLNSVMDTVSPVLISRGLDSAGRTATPQVIALIVAAVLVSGALSWIFNFFRQWNTAKAVGDVVLTIRRDAFDAVTDRDMSFYDEYPSGKIVSRVTSDTEDFAAVVTLTLNLMSQVLLVVLIAIAMFIIDWRLALLALTIAPVIVLVALGFRRIARVTTQRAQRARATVNALVQESISGISVAKNFRQEAKIYEQFRLVNKQAYGVNLRQGLVFSAIFPVLNTIAGIGTVIVVYFGGLSVLQGVASYGAWFLFVQAINIFWFPLTSIASFWSQFQQGLSSSERVFALIDADPRVVQTDSQQVQTLQGRIEFRHLDFRYSDQQDVLRDFDLTIPAGQTIALVGHTGAGKSTLGKLVARFYEFQGGELLIDGRDIRSLDLQSYRRHLGIVQQVPFLFSGSVADNIRYARPEATDAEVEEIARQIGGGDWIEALAHGLNTLVGEEGHGLSMGQRQLVALARILMQQPSVVILDEATASVDPLTEAQIQEGLDVVLSRRTSIVIAHRLSTIKTADRIIVLDHGRIVEEGTHDGLLASGGHYANLYNTYFRSQEYNYVPGSGFVPVKFTDKDIAQMTRAMEQANRVS